MKLMDIEDLAMRSFGELSAGQHQKAVIARGLAQTTKILLLDEPTANLDIKHQMNVARTLKRLVDGMDLVVIMICHDLNIAAKFSDRIILLSEGRIYRDGKPEEVLTRDTINKVYGVESMVQMIDGTPHIIITNDDSITDDETIEDYIHLCSEP